MTCAFPFFRERFFTDTKWAASESSRQPSQAPEAPLSPSRGGAGHLAASKGLAALDLSTIARGEAPPDELQARREKFARFEKLCSEVAPGLFVAGDVVARSRETLRQAGITHVINCVGFLYGSYFQSELCYKTLYLYDTPHEDITTVLYDVFDYIEAAQARGGRVLIHCSQGVSRSMTLAIAYLMWREALPFDAAFRRVKDIRGIANPNVGFTCQLLTWDKRRQAPLGGPRMYRIAPHSAAAPTHLVPKLLPGASLAALDPRGAFIVQLPDATFVWQGERCSPAWAEAAQTCAQALAKYEHASPPGPTIPQGEEPPALLAALAAPSNVSPRSEPSEAPGPPAVGEVALYDADFRMYAEGLQGATPQGAAPQGQGQGQGGEGPPGEERGPGAAAALPEPLPQPSPRLQPQKPPPLQVPLTETPAGAPPRGPSWDDPLGGSSESSRRHPPNPGLSERSLSGSGGGRPPKTPRSETGDPNGDTSPNQRLRKKGRGGESSTGSLQDLDQNAPEA